MRRAADALPGVTAFVVSHPMLAEDRTAAKTSATLRAEVNRLRRALADRSQPEAEAWSALADAVAAIPATQAPTDSDAAVSPGLPPAG